MTYLALSFRRRIQRNLTFFVVSSSFMTFHVICDKVFFKMVMKKVAFSDTLAFLIHSSYFHVDSVYVIALIS